MRNRTRWSILQIVLSLIGAFIAGTVYYADRNAINLPCTTGGGCSLVAASHWSHLFGVPVALLGVCGYVAIALLGVAKLFSESDRASRLTSWLLLLVSLGGTVFSWYLQYVAAIFIGAFCIWCRASAITMTLIFIFAAIERILDARLKTATENAARSAAA